MFWKKKRWIYASAAICLVAVVLLLPRIEVYSLRFIPGQSANDQLRPDRTELTDPNHIVNLVHPKPGSTILDIGCGFGMFTFPLARAVGDTGKVYATDIDPQAIQYVTDRVRQTGTQNITPVRVSVSGFDRFYHEHKFDLIFASDVVPLMRSPEDFFQQLRPSLTANTGRLWIINMRLDPDFSGSEFGDFSMVVAYIKSHRDDSPIVRRLSLSTMESFSSFDKSPASESFRKGLIKDLNHMLEDPDLWGEVQSLRLPLNPQREKVRNRLSNRIEQCAVSASKPSTADRAQEARRLLNRFVIQDVLQSDLWERAFSLDKFWSLQWDGILAPIEHDDLKVEIRLLLEKAGFELVQEHKSLNYYQVFEFKNSDPIRAN